MIHELVGSVLREMRRSRGWTLRIVSMRANVALGYLSEVERGYKEASAEVIISVLAALEMKPSYLYRELGRRLEYLEDRGELVIEVRKSVR